MSFLKKAIDELIGLEMNIKKEKSIKPWQRYLNPQPRHFATEEAIKVLNQMKEKLAKYEIEMKSAIVIDRASLFEIIAQCGLLKENITKEIEEFESERIVKNSLVRKKVDEKVAELTQNKINTIKGLNEKVISLRDEIRANLQRHINAVNLQYQTVIAEAQKLGKA